MRDLTHWLLESVWRSTLVAALCYVVPFLLLLAMSIQALVTLRQGMHKGLLVTLGSCVLGVITGFAINSLFLDVSYTDFINGLQWGLVLSLPIWLVAGLLRKTVSLTYAMQAMTIGYMLVFAVMLFTNSHILPDSIRQPIAMNVETLTTAFVDSQKQLDLPNNGAESQSKALGTEEITRINTFLVSIFEVVSIYILQMSIIMLARYWQSAVFKPKGFRDEFINLRTGSLVSIVLVSSAILIMITQNFTLSCILAGIVFIGSIWLSVVGLGLVHWIMNYYDVPWSVVIIFYLTLFLPVISGLFLVIIMLAALTDGLVDLRSNISKLKTRT